MFNFFKKKKNTVEEEPKTSKVTVNEEELNLKPETSETEKSEEELNLKPETSETEKKEPEKK